MTYPQNPQGQPQQPRSGPLPGQPYPASQPTPAPPYPGVPQQPFAPSAAGQPYPGGPGVYQQKPNGATAIIAGILAILGGVFAIIGVVASVVVISNVHTTMWQFYLTLVVDAVLVGLLFFGGIGLFLHKPAARLCTIIGCGLTIALGIVSAIVASAVTSTLHTSSSAQILGAGIGGALIGLIPPIATLVLAIVKPTADWVNYRPGAPAQQGGYPAPQGW